MSTFRIAAAFPNPGNVLRPGQFGRVKADTQVRHGGLLIPQVAVTEFQGLHQVYVAGTDGKAHETAVKLGSQIVEEKSYAGYGRSPGSGDA